jgi:hypothetical protein
MARIVLGLIGGVGNMPAAIARTSPTGARVDLAAAREANPATRDVRRRRISDAPRDRTLKPCNRERESRHEWRLSADADHAGAAPG